MYGSSTLLSGIATTRHVADVPNCSAKLMVSLRAWSRTSSPHASSPWLRCQHTVMRFRAEIFHAAHVTHCRRLGLIKQP